MFSQEELSKSDQDVEKSKHHKKHYEDKRKVHINTIQALKASLELKEQELTVRLGGVSTLTSYNQGHILFMLSFTFCVSLLNVCFPCLNRPVSQASVVKATEICPERSEVRRTARSLDSEISRLKLKISTQQDQQGDREEVIR